MNSEDLLLTTQTRVNESTNKDTLLNSEANELPDTLGQQGQGHGPLDTTSNVIKKQSQGNTQRPERDTSEKEFRETSPQGRYVKVCL
jgi:hypothetical protein